MAVHDVSTFVAEDKPEIIDPIESNRHADYWRVIVQPEANTINLATGKRFNYYEAYASLSQQPGDVPRVFGRAKKSAHLINGRGKLPARIGRNNHLASNLPHPEKPS